MASNINIGSEIREELKRQGRTVTWLSHQLGVSRMACYRIFHGYSIDTQMLHSISVLLGVDFFKFYSDAIGENETE